MNRKDPDKNHSGSTLDELLQEDGMLDEVEAIAIKRVIAWQLQTAMKKNKISKQGMAAQLRTSRSQVDRLLDPDHCGVTLGTLSKAAHAVGKRLVVRVSNPAPDSAFRRRAR